MYDIKPLQRNKIKNNQKDKLTELRKSNKEMQCIKPQIWGHSKSYVAKTSTNLYVSQFPQNVWALGSFQVNHIRHAGTIFQTFEEWIPRNLSSPFSHLLKVHKPPKRASHLC